MKLKDLNKVIGRGTDKRYYNEEGYQIEYKPELENKEIIEVNLTTGMLEEYPYLSIQLKIGGKAK